MSKKTRRAAVRSDLTSDTASNTPADTTAEIAAPVALSPADRPTAAPCSVETVAADLARAAAIPLPANVPTGSYAIDVKLFARGVQVSSAKSALEVIKTGIEQYVADAAHDHGLLYGLITALMALLIGWFGSVVFRRD